MMETRAPRSRPARSAPVSTLAFLAPVSVCALMYARTLCPAIFWGDGMELAAAANCLGIAHPTGYPLYILLGHILMGLPIGGPGLRMNLLSAVSMLAAVGLLYGLAGDVFRLAAPAGPGRAASTRVLQGAVATMFGLSSLPWMHAVQTEVYATLVAILIGCFRLFIRAYERRSLPDALALFFLAGIAFQAHMLAVILLPPLVVVTLRLLLPPTPPTAPAPCASSSPSTGEGGVQGTPPHSSSHHPLSTQAEGFRDDSPSHSAFHRPLSTCGEGVGGEAPPDAGAPLPSPLPFREGQGEGRSSGTGDTMASTPPSISILPGARRFRVLLLAPLCFAIGISGYLALPIRARANPPMNWGDPSTVHRLVSHLRGGEYTDSRFLTNPFTLQPIRGEMLRDFLHMRALDAMSWADPARQPKVTLSESPAPRSVITGAMVWLGAAIGWLVLARRRFLLAAGLAGTVTLSVGIYLCYVIADIDVYFQSLWPLLLVLFWTGWSALASRLGPRVLHRALALVSVLAAAGVASANYRQCDLSGYTEAEEYAHNLLEPLEKGAILITSDDSATFAAWYEQTVKGGRPDVTVFGVNLQFRAWYSRYLERAAAEGLSFFTADLPAQPQSIVCIAIGSGVIAPNLEKRPIYLATPDSWIRSTILPYWKGSLVADLYPAASWRPLPWADAPAASIYRLGDNPAYREEQAKQFNDIFGNLLPGKKPGGME